MTEGCRWAYHAGAALFLTGTAAVIAGTSGRWRAAWPWPTSAIPVVVLVGFASSLPPAATTGVVGAVLVATVLAGIHHQRRGKLQSAKT